MNKPGLVSDGDKVIRSLLLVLARKETNFVDRSLAAEAIEVHLCHLDSLVLKQPSVDRDRTATALKELKEMNKRHEEWQKEMEEWEIEIAHQGSRRRYLSEENHGGVDCAEAIVAHNML